MYNNIFDDDSGEDVLIEYRLELLLNTEEFEEDYVDWVNEGF